MGKIYDALKRAENEAKKKRAEDDIAAETAPVPPATRAAPERESARDTKKAPSLQVLPEGAELDRKAVAPFTLKGVSDKKAKRAPVNLPPTLIALSAPQSPEAEQFRILKSRVLSFCKEKGLRTLLITSCMPEEGKSTVAANLSVCIANGVNDHALLFDCDLRRPSIHKVFNLNNHGGGLADYLSQDSMPLQKVIHATGIEKLTIIPAGTIPDNPSELLSSNKMIELLQEVKEQYSDRYIVLDSTPAYQTPEPAILSRHVDGILLVVRAGSTGRDIVTRVVESLGKNRIIGVVFNMVNEPVRSYYYNYNSYYSKKTDD
jgi:exopolysaccharide/PEP-CTERM locus tyrosine autokinase